jgi:hypothetical protein
LAAGFAAFLAAGLAAAFFAAAMRVPQKK